MKNGNSDNWLNSLSFCPCCNYAVDKEMINSSCYDFECSHCGNAKLSEYYSIGSDTHRKQIRAWEYGNWVVKNNSKNKMVKILIPPSLPGEK